MADQKKYLYLATGTIMMMFLGLLYAWSMFAIHFKQIYTSWSSSELSMTFTISMVSFCIGGFLSGKVSKFLKAKVVIIVAALFLFTGFFSLSKLNPQASEQSLKKLYLFYGVLCGAGVGLAYNSIIGCVNKWFSDRIGFSSGILLLGFGLGGMILGSVVNILVIDLGLLKCFSILAYAILAVLTIGAFILKVPEINLKSQNVNVIKEVGIDLIKTDYTALEMLKTPVFWCFFLWAVAVSSAGLLVINSAATIAVTFGAPAVLGLMVTVFNGLGRVFYGTLFDKFGYKRAMVINNILLIIAGTLLCLGAVSKNVILILVGMLIVGLSYGGAPSLASAVIHSFYGSKNYSLNLSLCTFSLIPSAFIGPMTANALLSIFDGEYTATFAMVIVFAVVALVLKTLMQHNSKQIAN